jgi:hypothetical protein
MAGLSRNTKHSLYQKNLAACSLQRYSFPPAGMESHSNWLGNRKHAMRIEADVV